MATGDFNLGGGGAGPGLTGLIGTTNPGAFDSTENTVNTAVNFVPGLNVANTLSGLFGGPTIGGLFGGKGHHNIGLPNFDIDKKLLATRGIQLPFGNLSSSAFRRLGPKIAQQQVALQKARQKLISEFRAFGVAGPELQKINEAFSSFSLQRGAGGPAGMQRRGQQQINMLQNLIRKSDQFKLDNPDNPGVRRLLEESLLTGPIPRSPASETAPDKIKQKKPIRRAALRAASRFIRFPQQEQIGRGGFPSKTKFFGSISELDQDADRIIPSGFTSKQPTTQNRALALDSLR